MRWAIAIIAVTSVTVATVLLRDSRAAPAEAEQRFEPPAARASPAQRAALDRATQIVDDAVSRHELTAESVSALRQLGGELPERSREELRMKLVRALNRQELKLDPRAGLP